MDKKQSQSGSVHLVIVILIVVGLLSALCFVYWKNFMQPKTSETKSNNTTTSATTASPTITSELLSNDVYQIYTYSHESKDGNGDPCNFVSVLTLYNSHNMAVNSNSSCLGTETWMGTYSTSLSKTSIQFTALFDYAGHHDYSGNPPTITINSDGTVSSSMFDAGRGAYIKR